MTARGDERIAALKPGETVDVAHYRLTFDGLFNRSGPNYRDLVGHFTVRRTSGDLIGAMEPGRRTFRPRQHRTAVLERERRRDLDGGEHRRGEQTLRGAEKVAALPSEQRPERHRQQKRDKQRAER